MSALPPTHNPPSYSPPDEALFSDYDVPIPPDEILPDYNVINQSSSGSGPFSRPDRGPTTRPPPKEFEYKVEGGKGSPIAVLTLVADALYSKNIPTYIGAGPIKGNVRLRSDKADGVQAVVISIIGRYITGIEEEEAIFLDLSTTVHSQSADLPKPQGDSYLWPFEFKIPTELTLPVWKKGQEESAHFAPPQTFTERLLRGSIKYEIRMKIKRGMLRTDYRISTVIGYIPLIRPPPFPLLRSFAYEQRTPLVGPDSDYEGWHALDEVRIKGPSSTMSSDVEIGCKLYMAQPLSYTIGTSIPLALKLTVPTDAHHTLDELLATPTIITVRLRRTVASHLPQQKLKIPDNFHMVNRKEVKDLYEAVWWTPEQTQAGDVSGNVPPEKGDINSSADHVRWMNGEIHIGNEVKPSSGMPYFKIEYAVVLLPFAAPGARSADIKKTEVLQVQAVEMVTSFAPGPRPVRYAPPGYTSSIVPDQVSREPFGGFVPSSSGFM